MRKFAIAAALLAGTIATPALAQDNNLGGFRVEGLVGYDRPSIEDEGADGVVYGMGVGYDFQSGNAVFGIEAEATDSSADETVAGFALPGDTLRVRASRDLYVGGRAGFGVGGNSLIYAKAGYTNARFNYQGSDGSTIYATNIDTDGYRLGAGVEQKFGGNAFAKLEYRYSNYQEGEVDFEATGVTDSDRFDIDTDRHQIVASVGIRF